MYLVVDLEGFTLKKMMILKKILGIDVGGSGIKGAIVHTKKGELLTERYRIPTPDAPTPDAVADVISQIASHFEWKGPIGVGFPAVIQGGISKTAANVDKSFIGTNIEALISQQTKSPVRIINDADAAGLAEMKFGAGKDKRGVVLIITVGTGIGTVLFSNGNVVENTELGHLILPNGQEAEQYASDATRQKLDLSWTDWGKRFNEYLTYMESLFWPDLIIIGGGVSKHYSKYDFTLNTKCSLVPAQLMNNAGIVGAALAVKWSLKDKI